MRRCYEFLNLTSRSFSAVIQALDPELRLVVLPQYISGFFDPYPVVVTPTFITLQADTMSLQNLSATCRSGFTNLHVTCPTCIASLRNQHVVGLLDYVIMTNFLRVPACVHAPVLTWVNTRLLP